MSFTGDVRVRFPEIDRALADHLCEQFGSPVYILDESGISQRLGELEAAARAVYRFSTVAISYKTNPTRGMLAKLHRTGAFAEVVSGDEYRIARSLGVPENQIVFNGPVKSDQDLQLAVHGGSFVHCDHADEVDRIESIARSGNRIAQIGIRLHFPAEDSWERFGFEVGRGINCPAMNIVSRIIRSRHLKLSGLHSHAGTNIRDLETFHRFSSQYAGFAASVRDRTGCELQWIDIGGGLAGIAPLVSENRMEPYPLPPVDAYCRAVITPLLPYLTGCHRPPRLILEPGRTLFNAFGGMLVTVIGRRPAGHDGVAAVILDAGITSLALAHKYNHPIHVCHHQAESGPVKLLGPTCMEWDIVSRPVHLPRLSPGDKLVIYGTGCYSMALASSFTRFRPGTVGWNGEGYFRWLRKPETLEHSGRLDVVDQPVLRILPGRLRDAA